MPAIRDNEHAHGLLVDAGPDDVIVTWLFKRFKEMPSESLADLLSLAEICQQPDVSQDEREEVYETMREILFPQLIGSVVIKKSNEASMPRRVKQRIDWIGRTVKKYREEKGWNQKKLAEESGLRQPQISRLESGIHSPSHKTLEKIAKALGKTVGDIDPSY